MLQHSEILLILVAVILLLLVDLALGLRGGAYFYYSKKRKLSGKGRVKRWALYAARLLRYGVLAMAIYALADPVQEKVFKNINREGVDIVLALDISKSMSGEDFKPKNRLFVAKKVIHDFVDRRESDRIALVVFAGEAYLQSPLTLDYGILTKLLKQIEFSSVKEAGTAIGNALALSSSLLYDSKGKSKVIILLTDGVNNRGNVEPMTIAQAAGRYDIKIYTIGIGKKGEVHGSVRDSRGDRNLFHAYGHYDEDMLRRVAELSGGKFFEATNTKELWRKIQEINRLEKTLFQKKSYREIKSIYDIYLWLALLSYLVILFVEMFYVQRFP